MLDVGRRWRSSAPVLVATLAMAAGGTVVAPAGVAAAGALAAVECGVLPAKAPAAGRPVEVEASLGDIGAAITGTATAQSGEGIDSLVHMGINITVAGRLALRAQLATPYGVVGGDQDALLSIGGSPQAKRDEPLCVASFGGDNPESAVLVGLFTMGAHCCTFIDAYIVASAGIATPPIEQQIGNPGVELETVDGHAVLVTADNSFAYAFTAFAFSGMPIRVLELRGKAFVNTTRSYPSLITPDAASWWKYFQQAQAPGSQDPTRGTGALAPWVADECMLGDGAQAWAMVNKLNAEGKLGTSANTPWPTGTDYVKALSAFLVAHGYCGS